MKLSGRIAINISKIYPEAVKKRIKKLLMYGGIKKDVSQYLGLSFLTSTLLLLLLIAYDLLFKTLNITTYLLGIGIFFGTQGVFIIYPYFKSEKRAKKVEEFLPDFLNLMSANIRSGMTPFSAMMGAAKEDFGILSEEVEDAIALSMGSESYERILKILVKHINSIILDRMVKLLITGMKTGGSISMLLEGAAEEVTQMSALKKELVTSVRSYMIFISMVIIVGLPFLLTVSTFFVQTVQDLQTMISPSEITPGITTSTITLEFLSTISYIVIIATSFFAALLVGSVVDESFVQGLKYFIPFLALSIIIYVLASSIIPNMIGTVNL